MRKLWYKALALVSALLLLLMPSASASGLFDGLLEEQKTQQQGLGLFDGFVNPSEKIISAQERQYLDALEQMLGVSPQITLEEDTVWAEYTVSKSKKYTLMMYTQEGMQMLAFAPVNLLDVDGLLEQLSQVGRLLDFEYGEEEKCLYLMMGEESVENRNRLSPSAPPQPSGSSRQYRCSVCQDQKDCPTCLGLKECENCWGEKEYSCTWCIGGECLACDDGQILVGFDSKDRPRYQKCSQCTGGKCRYCKGDGRITCESCRGTGKCQTCGGNGKCPACR